MRSRAYRPEAPVCLESRSLLSVAAAPSADPFVYPRSKINFATERTREAFFLYGRNPDIIELRDEIDNFVVLIPFGRVDGLGITIDRTLNTMHQNLAARVPRAVRTAQHDILAAIHAQVSARVRTGDLVLR